MNRDPSQEATGALTCWEVAESTSVYLDAQFDESSHARLARHMAVCAGCRAYVEQIRLVREALKGLPHLVPSPERCLFLRQRFAEC